jgi:cysteinyl-tRNA synthetase
MSLRLYNTLTRTIEPLEPVAPPRVTFYMCGPTVWNYAHIGNFRTFLLGDLLRRYLRYRGYDVFMVMNLTDVDDRTIKAAAGAGRSLTEHTGPFVQAFFEDRDYLRILPADVYPRATEYVEPMIRLVESLIRRGFAYVGEDGSVYFAVGKFPTYGRLSRLDRRELKAGARVASDEYSKEDVRDFALWKRAAPEDESVGAAWDAPFGRGRPGWHLECSAMSLQEIKSRFGVETLDLHAGGIDLVFPHHENEIAQSEGATGTTFARMWLHGEFLNVRGSKMSKRFGNILTVRDLKEEGVDAGALRYLVFSTHYRQPLNFTDEALAAAAEGTRRLADFRQRLARRTETTRREEQDGTNKTERTGRNEQDGTNRTERTRRNEQDGTNKTERTGRNEQDGTNQTGETGRENGAGEGAGDGPGVVRQLEEAFQSAMDDDLDAPAALAALFDFVRAANRELDAGTWSADAAAQALGAFDRINGVLDILPTARDVDDALRVWVEERIAARKAARAARDFAAADAIRAELAGRGVELEDTPQGTRWKVKT